MSCFSPLPAFQLDDGSISFVERGAVRRPLRLSCGQCLGCRLRRASSWALRIVHESKLHTDNCFVTLTYDNDHYVPSLIYSHFQLFLKRLRFHFSRVSDSPIRFFVVGEYGERLMRPHFHAMLFGVGFRNEGMVGKDIYRNSLLERLWDKGFSSIGQVTPESAAYVGRYSLKKITGDRAESHYSAVDSATGEVVNLVPEFAHMSLKPGIGFGWFQKYWRDVYVARDGVVVPGGTVVPPPKYYDRLLEAMAPSLLDEKEFDRYVKSKAFADDCTPDRLRVREICTKARLDFYSKRSL